MTDEEGTDYGIDTAKKIIALEGVKNALRQAVLEAKTPEDQKNAERAFLEYVKQTSAVVLTALDEMIEEVGRCVFDSEVSITSVVRNIGIESEETNQIALAQVCARLDGVKAMLKALHSIGSWFDNYLRTQAAIEIRYDETKDGAKKK